MWHANAFGYLFSAVVGFLFVSIIVDGLHKSIVNSPIEPIPRIPWIPALLGIVERVLYTASLQIGKGEFIGIWLAIKVAGQWSTWNEGLQGRAVFQIFLIGNGLPVLYAGIGFKMTEWLADSKTLLQGILVPLIVIVGTVAMKYWIRSEEAVNKKNPTLNE